MQIAEKYRKELRELNEGPLHLPTYAQGDSKEDMENPTAGPDTPKLKETWKDEVEVVKDANGFKDEQSTVFSEISESEPFLSFMWSGNSMFIITATKLALSQS